MFFSGFHIWCIKGFCIVGRGPFVLECRFFVWEIETSLKSKLLSPCVYLFLMVVLSLNKELFLCWRVGEQDEIISLKYIKIVFFNV